MSTRSPRPPASTRCSSALTICRSRSLAARRRTCRLRKSRRAIDQIVRGGQEGRQDPGHLLPRCRTRARHGQARLPFHRRRQRPRLCARRRSPRSIKALKRLKRDRPDSCFKTARHVFDHLGVAAAVTLDHPDSRASSASHARLSARCLRRRHLPPPAPDRSRIRSGNETKSSMCGPTGTCRLKPRPAKRRSLVSACHSMRSASVGLRRSSRAQPAHRRALGRRAARTVLGQEIAQHLRLLAIEHAAARRTFAALRERGDDAVQACGCPAAVGAMRWKILRRLTLMVPRFSSGRKNSTFSSSRSRSAKKASSCCLAAGGDFSGMANGRSPPLPA